MTIGKTQVSVEDKAVVISRTFDAPKSLLWKVWTDPAHVAKWWGPHIFTSTAEIDFRVGGSFRLTMHSGALPDYPLTGNYLEIIEGEKIVNTLDLDEHPQEWHDLVNANRPSSNGKNVSGLSWIITFQEADGRTLLTIRSLFASNEDRDAFVKLQMGEGWSESLDKLESLLQSLTN
ncbi:MAG TPA: SRPBCC domain-containing protein [Candidatus Kapabacteria bacterium]